jgi:hypothetical protein
MVALLHRAKKTIHVEVCNDSIHLS